MVEQYFCVCKRDVGARSINVASRLTIGPSIREATTSDPSNNLASSFYLEAPTPIMDTKTATASTLPSTIDYSMLSMLCKKPQEKKILGPQQLEKDDFDKNHYGGR